MREIDDNDDLFGATGDSKEKNKTKGKANFGAGATTSNKNSQDDKKQKFAFKVFIEFENRMIDFFSIRNVVLEERQNLSFEQGYSYDIVLTSGYDEIVFSYLEEDARTKRYEELKNKLREAKTIII